MERDETGARKVDPYHLLFRGGQFYLLGRSHEREAIRVFRLSRIRGKVAYATKAEHDFKRPDDFDPRVVRRPRADWQFGDDHGRSPRSRVGERLAWQVERHFGRYGEIRPGDDGDLVFATPYASARQVISFVLGLGDHAHVAGPTSSSPRPRSASALIEERHEGELELAKPAAARAAAPRRARGRRRPRAATPRSARSASPGSSRSRRSSSTPAAPASGCSSPRSASAIQVTEAELREDVNVLNVVNFGGGSYVLYAEIHDDGTIEVDPEPYADNFDRPARLLPVEAKALVAAIDLIGDHLPEGALTGAREKIVAALGADPLEQGLQVADAGADDSAVARVVSKAIAGRKLLKLDYYKANEDEFCERIVEPYALINGREGWYVATFDPEKDDVRHFRLDRVAPRRGPAQGLHAAARGQPRRRRRGLAAHRRGRGLAHRARLDLAPSAPAGRARSGRSRRSSPTARSSSS